jgi:hypothetical protein
MTHDTLPIYLDHNATTPLFPEGVSVFHHVSRSGSRLSPSSYSPRLTAFVLAPGAVGP